MSCLLDDVNKKRKEIMSLRYWNSTFFDNLAYSKPKNQIHIEKDKNSLNISFL